jgi:calcineurin-like phosphoesterase family protein
MSVWFCSDLHLGHKGIERFRKHVSSQEDNEKQIIDCWKQVVTKRDDVYVLGDACFTREAVDTIATLEGRKHLIRGNHDKCNTWVYLTAFEEVYGLLKYKEFWLSHAPIHPDELRGKINLHGHVHYNSVNDPRYFNCCVENIMSLYNRPLIRLEEIRSIVHKSL